MTAAGCCALLPHRFGQSVGTCSHYGLGRAAGALGWQPVVPPMAHRCELWDYDQERGKERNIVKRLCNRLKRFRRIATRYDKLDSLLLGFIHFTLIFDNLSRVV